MWSIAVICAVVVAAIGLVVGIVALVLLRRSGYASLRLRQCIYLFGCCVSCLPSC